MDKHAESRRAGVPTTVLSFVRGTGREVVRRFRSVGGRPTDDDDTGPSVRRPTDDDGTVRYGTVTLR